MLLFSTTETPQTLHNISASLAFLSLIIILSALLQIGQGL
jgi:hypothetical protein